jgi:hypothetical protein
VLVLVFATTVDISFLLTDFHDFVAVVTDEAAPYDVLLKYDAPLRGLGPRCSPSSFFAEPRSQRKATKPGLHNAFNFLFAIFNYDFAREDSILD